jgi:hypothetical protein
MQRRADAGDRDCGQALANRMGVGAGLDILMERRRQITQEGYTPAHDDYHTTGELAQAAAAYALATTPYAFEARTLWPWERATWKPSTWRRRNLVRAAALIIAEIERLDRAGESENPHEQPDRPTSPPPKPPGRNQPRGPADA